MPLVDNAWYVDGSTGVTVNDLTTANNAATATLTLSITVPAGALIVVVVNEATSTTAGTCADATNGAYTAGPTQAISGAAGILQIFYFANSAALSAVTLTYTKQTSGRVATLSAFYATGIATSTPLDTAVTASTAVSGAAPTVTSGTPAVAGELIVGAYGSSAAAGTFTQPANTAFLAPVATSQTQATANVAGGHINVNGNLAVTYAPTTVNAVNNALIVVGFKAASTPSIGWYGVTKWAASTTKVCGNLVIQNATPVINAERVFVCIASTAGTGQTAATEPAWQTTAQATRGVKFTDNAVTWQEATGIGALNGDLTNTPTWTTVKNTAVTLGQVIQNVAGTLILICSTPGTAGNGAEPSWAAFTNAGATTVDNGATWTTLGASFSSWAAPHARLTNACTNTWQQAGNKVFVASEHFEVQASILTVTPLGSATTTTQILCVDKLNVPPGSANIATGGTISTEGATTLTLTGAITAYWYGLTFQAGTNPNAAAGAGLNAGNTTARHTFKNCTLKINSSSGSKITFPAVSCDELFDSCTFGLGSNSTSGFTSGAGGRIRIIGGSITVGTTTPTSLFTASPMLLTMQDIDLSSWGAGKNLIGSAATSGEDAIFVNCKLGASVTVLGTPSTSNLAIRATIIRCDSGATNYRTERYDNYGSQVIETTIVRTGGASDGTTPISWKIVAGQGIAWGSSYEAIPITVWCETTGSHTITIYGTTTGGGVPNDDDIWIEFDYLGSASFPQGTTATTTKANALAASAATNNSSDASTWGGGGAGNGFKMVTPSFTVNQKGPVNIVIKVAKAAATYYVDPRPSINGITVNRSLILAPGVYANELGGGSGSVSYIS